MLKKIFHVTMRAGVNTGYGNDPASRLYESVDFQRVALDYSYVKKV